MKRCTSLDSFMNNRGWIGTDMSKFTTITFYLVSLCVCVGMCVGVCWGVCWGVCNTPASNQPPPHLLGLLPSFLGNFSSLPTRSFLGRSQHPQQFGGWHYVNATSETSYKRRQCETIFIFHSNCLRTRNTLVFLEICIKLSSLVSPKSQENPIAWTTVIKTMLHFHGIFGFFVSTGLPRGRTCIIIIYHCRSETSV